MALRKTVLFSSPSGPPTWRIRYAPTTGYVWHFKKQSCLRPLRGCLHGVSNTPLQLDTCDPSKYRCKSSIGYVWLFEKQSRFRPLRARAVGRIQYAPTIGYVRFFEIPMQFPNWIRTALQKIVLFPSPSGPWSGRIRYASTTGYVRGFKKMDLYTSPSVASGGAYSIRPYDRVRTILRNIDAIFQPGACDSSKY